MENNQSIISWTDELEEILKTIAEKSLSYSWLHDQSEKKFNKLNQYLSLPVIVLSTLSGASSVGISNFGDTEMAAVIIGIVSIGTGILQTINSFFGYAKRAELHKVSAISYKKLHRFILIELSLQRDQRLNAKAFLKMVRENTDRLIEIQPGIDQDIIEAFKVKFRDDFKKVKIPEECNGLDPLEINRKLTKKETFIDIINKIETKKSFFIESPEISPTHKLNIDIEPLPNENNISLEITGK